MIDAVLSRISVPQKMSIFKAAPFESVPANLLSSSDSRSSSLEDFDNLLEEIDVEFDALQREDDGKHDSSDDDIDDAISKLSAEHYSSKHVAGKSTGVMLELVDKERSPPKLPPLPSAPGQLAKMCKKVQAKRRCDPIVRAIVTEDGIKCGESAACKPKAKASVPKSKATVPKAKAIVPKAKATVLEAKKKYQTQKQQYQLRCRR